jgi:2-polyprenyl-3-methyl-5-hydroxy-6-metoxy-1,4-benzoquinol methylase
VIGRDRFRAAYRQACREVLAMITPERQEVLAAHNLGLHPDHTDLRTYLEASERRYVRIVERFDALSGSRSPTCLDVGGFLGALPLALRRCGLQVTLVEEYGYYHGAFDELRDFLNGEGVDIWAADFTEPLQPPPDRQYSLVTNLAMLEHLPSSPKPLLENLRTMIEPRGLLFVDVPNIAFWPNRLHLLRGKSIHQPFELMYDSAAPFLGHHREYTREELAKALSLSGFRVLSIEAFNYSPRLRGLRGYRLLMTFFTEVLPSLLTPGNRELLMATAAPATGSGEATEPPEPSAAQGRARARSAHADAG